MLLLVKTARKMIELAHFLIIDLYPSVIMKTLMQSLPAVIGYMLLSIALVSCSGDDETISSSGKQKTIIEHYDHIHDSLVNMDKHPFEHEFARQCIVRETADSVNKAYDSKRFAEPCLCIAVYLMKDLTAVESEKFLHEKKHTQSLRIRYETAAYNCLQKQQ